MRHFLCLFVVAGLLLAQPGRRPSPRRAPDGDAKPVYQAADLCILRGLVRDKVTGEPVRKATLSLVLTANRGPGNARPSSTTTDAAGRFEFTGIEPGRYRLNATRNGFVGQNFGGAVTGTPIVLSRGQKLDGIDFRLVPHSVVTGRIFDEDGEPVVFASVQLMRYTYTDRGKALRPFGSARTNDLGEYRIFGIGPGKYFVEATLQRLPPATASARQGVPEENYASTFYPGTTDPASAVPLDVALGGVAQGVDIRLAKARTFSVSGRVSGGAGGSRSGMVMLVRRGDSPFSNRFGTRSGQWDLRTGAFNIRGVAPGSYTVVAQSRQSRSESWSGLANIEVSGGDVSNVDISIQPGQAVSGRVRIEGENDTPIPPNIRVIAESQGLEWMGSQPGSVNDDGEFTISSVGAGSYRLRITSLPPGHYVKSIRLADRDLLDGGVLELPGGAPVSGIDVVLSPKAAALDGVATGSKGDPAAGATMVLIPPADHPQRDRLIFRAVADQNGQYSLRDIPPGDYRLYAFAGAEDGEDRDPNLFIKHESASEKISLAESGHEIKTVKTISLLN